MSVTNITITFEDKNGKNEYGLSLETFELLTEDDRRRISKTLRCEHVFSEQAERLKCQTTPTTAR